MLLELGLAWIQDYWRAFRGDRALLIVYLVFMPAALDGVKSGSGSFGGRKSSGLGFTAQAAHRNCMRIFLFTLTAYRYVQAWRNKNQACGVILMRGFRLIIRNI